MIEFHDVYATDGAVGVLYALMKERDSDTSISHKKCPSYADHEDFIERRPYWLWYLIASESEWIGTVNITHQNEIGIAVFKTHQGEGWGRKTLVKLIADIEPRPAIPGVRTGYFLANINPKNSRSIRLFESIGFKICQQTYSYEP